MHIFNIFTYIYQVCQYYEKILTYKRISVIFKSLIIKSNYINNNTKNLRYTKTLLVLRNHLFNKYLFGHRKITIHRTLSCHGYFVHGNERVNRAISLSQETSQTPNSTHSVS